LSKQKPSIKMKTLKKPRPVYITLVLLLACLGVSCDEDDPNISGTWLVQEPPELMARINRADGSVPVFDVVFTIQGNSISDIDLLIDGDPVDGETGSVKDNDVNIQYQNFNLNLQNCRKIGQNTLLIGTMEYTLPDGTSETHKGISVGSYN
jgi:hypothetical protein